MIIEILIFGHPVNGILIELSTKSRFRLQSIFQTMNNKMSTQISLQLPPSSRKITRRHLTTVTQSRFEKIRQKNTAYPKSNPNKIVFISNKTGNGFCQQKFAHFKISPSIPIENMLQQINRACYFEWAKFHFHSQEEDFSTIKIGLFLILFIICIALILQFTFIANYIPVGLDVCNYLMYAVLASLLVIACKISCIEKEEKNRDDEMIKVIKQKLHQINCRQITCKGKKVEYRWSCHTECLWIAINI